MKILEVGAFDAKTHLSQLLDEVENGAVVRISRRGKPIAVLRPDETISRQAGLEAIANLRTLCPGKLPIEEVVALAKTGRER